VENYSFAAIQLRQTYDSSKLTSSRVGFNGILSMQVAAKSCLKQNKMCKSKMSDDISCS